LIEREGERQQFYRVSQSSVSWQPRSCECCCNGLRKFKRG